MAEVERVFHSELGFAGDARAARASSRCPRAAASGSRAVSPWPRSMPRAFPIEGLEATVLARPDALIAHIEKARYAGRRRLGPATASRTSPAATGAPSPMTPLARRPGISVERFFGDLKLPGHGALGSGGAVGDAALGRGRDRARQRRRRGSRSSRDPRCRSCAGASGSRSAAAATWRSWTGASASRAPTFRFPASTLDATGGLRIGEWMPDFDFQLRSRDLAEIDRLFQNFVGGRRRPRRAPSASAASGEVEGHIAKSWSNPEVTAQFSAENARYGGVLFGSVRGAADMHDGAFVFHPLRVVRRQRDALARGHGAVPQGPGAPDARPDA